MIEHIAALQAKVEALETLVLKMALHARECGGYDNCFVNTFSEEIQQMAFAIIDGEKAKQ